MRKKAEFTSLPARCHRWNTDSRLCLQAHVTPCAFDGRDQGSHQRGTVHEDAEGCHTCQRCAPREGARDERHLSLSARDQTSVTSPMRHPRAPRKSRHSPLTSPRSASSPRGKETQADNRSISICVCRTALRHPVVSTSNAESVEVREDASEYPAAVSSASTVFVRCVRRNHVV